MKPALTTSIVLVLIAAVVSWFLLTHERKEEVYYTGYTGEARWNRYLAAERLLNALGIEADTRDAFQPTDWLPAPTDTLVIPVNPTIMTPAESHALYSWVEVDGGHLVILPPDELNDDVHEFMTTFGFDYEYRHDAAEEIEEDVVADEDANASAESDDVYDYTVALSSTPYRISNQWGGDVVTLEDELGNIAARSSLGNGFVTVLGSASYFTNAYIEDADHARLLLDVVAGYVDPGIVWFVSQAAFPSLAEVIWVSMPYVVITLLAGFLLWLWAALPRFGPKVEPITDDRRSIGEHISAAGSFEWRHDGAKALADSVVNAVLHEAERKHPGIGRLPADKQAQSLAHLTGIDAQVILDAFTAAGEPRPREFTENIQLLQTIRKAL